MEEQSFAWTSNAAKAFENLNHAFTYTNILIHKHLVKLLIVEADTFDFDLESVLSKTKDKE